MAPPSIAIIVPCYNESARLNPKPWLKFLAHPGSSAISFFFANDGSTDDTQARLEELSASARQAAQRYGAHVFHFPQRRGKGEVVRRAALRVLQECPEFDYIGFWDADLATPLAELLEVIALLEQRALDGVFCSRIKRLGAVVRRKPTRHVLGRVFATAASLVLDLPVYDTQCGAKVFRTECLRSVLAEPFVSTWIFDVELIMRMARSGFDRLYEKPVHSWTDVPGSKLTLRHMAKVPVDLWRLHRLYNRKK